MQYSFHHSSFYLCSILFITPASTYAVFFSSLQLLFIQFSFEKFYATPLSPKCLLVVKLYLPCPVITKLGLITTVVALRSSKPLCVRCNRLNLFVHIPVISIGWCYGQVDQPSKIQKFFLLHCIKNNFLHAWTPGPTF